MNRSDLIKAVAKREGLTDKEATETVDRIFSGFRDALVKGERVEIRGFGSFTIRDYESYTGRNPRTGESTEVKPKKLPYFKVGKELKDKLYME